VYGGAVLGRNIPLLLVHGIGDSALTWAVVLRRLARGHDVYAVDLLGHGLSGLPCGRAYASLGEHLEILETFVREVIGRPALVVGNSLGGMLALRLALAAPEWTRGVVLLNPGGAPLGGRAAYDAFFAKISDQSLSTAYRVSGEMFGAVPRLLLLPILRSLQRMFQRPVILDAYGASDDSVFLSADEMRALAVPAGLVWGMRDHFLPEGSFEFFYSNLPRATRLLLDHCGHLPQRERPRSVIRFVRSFAAALRS
jgi:pimeloyl-ACP methyl ester carboxylesterase